MSLAVRSWAGRVLDAEALCIVLADDPEASTADLARAVSDLEAAGDWLSGLREGGQGFGMRSCAPESPEGRLALAIGAFAGYCRRYGEAPPPPFLRLLDSYLRDVPDLSFLTAGVPVNETVASWEVTAETRLSSGVRLNLAEVGLALAISLTAARLKNHAGLLVEVGGDSVARGTDGRGKRWKLRVDHEEIMGGFDGSRPALASSRTSDPASTGSEFVSATVAAPTVLEAILAAKLLVIAGRDAVRLDRDYRVVVTDRSGRASVFHVEDRRGGDRGPAARWPASSWTHVDHTGPNLSLGDPPG